METLPIGEYQKLPKMPGIYAIECATNGKTYIGQAQNIYKGWAANKSIEIQKIRRVNSMPVQLSLWGVRTL